MLDGASPSRQKGQNALPEIATADNSNDIGIVVFSGMRRARDYAHSTHHSASAADRTDHTTDSSGKHMQR
jgi:hypothetical protein